LIVFIELFKGYKNEYFFNKQEQEGDRERWQTLPAQERGDLERQYAHTGQLAR
jgi:hypothetical protein